MFKRTPLLIRFVIFLVLPICAALMCFYYLMLQTVPDSSGEIYVSEISSSIKIQRNSQGVPFISASSDNDAFFALGFVHAQDRMFQLELQRRLAKGTLSEVFGKETLQQDIWFRTLDLYNAAQSSWEALDNKAKASLTAYANGINSWITSNQQLPPEFKLLGIQPKPWSVYDSLSWMKVFALDLGGNFRREVDRLIAAQTFNDKQLSLLFPEYPVSGPTTVESIKESKLVNLNRLSNFLSEQEEIFHLGGKYTGSNAWVVSGKKTHSGAAIMASDPHLSIQIPSLWYAAELSGASINVSGMTLVGLPIVIFGRNHSITWSGTNLTADVQDLYFERIHKSNRKLYLHNEQWVPFTSRIESINVKADFPQFLTPELEPVQIKIESSRHGPVISEAFGLKDEPLSLRWTALDNHDTSYQAFFNLNYAKDWDSFSSALAHHVAPTMNILYADIKGNIGFSAAGKIPMRNQGKGLLPVSGWSEQFDWKGYIPFLELPKAYNPDSGIIISANNKIIGAEYPHFISQEWAPPARAQRIKELLGDNENLLIDDMKNIQADVKDISFSKLRLIIQSHQSKNEQNIEAINLLNQWQGEMKKDSAAATIFKLWLRQLKSQLLSDELDGSYNKKPSYSLLRRLISDTQPDSLAHVLANNSSQWCDNKLTKTTESCEELIEQTLSAAIRSGEKFFGHDDIAEWRWGEIHKTRYSNQAFKGAKMLEGLFQREVSSAGSANSINVAASRFIPQEGFIQNFGAGYRQIVEMIPNGVSHLYMNSTGQSGNIFSSHYDDMVEPFNRVEYFKLKTEESTDKILTLNPNKTQKGS